MRTSWEVCSVNSIYNEMCGNWEFNDASRIGFIVLSDWKDDETVVAELEESGFLTVVDNFYVDGDYDQLTIRNEDGRCFLMLNFVEVAIDEMV